MTTKRIVVGAHYGLRDWLAQRVTAVVMAVYTIVLLVAVLFGAGSGYAGWASLFAEPWMKVFTLLAVIAVGYHAWIGVRDIFMDYIKPASVRLILQVLTIVVLAGYACWAVIILWRV